MIDETSLKKTVEYACDLDGSEESERWKKWFIRVVDAEVNRQNAAKTADSIVGNCEMSQ